MRTVFGSIRDGFLLKFNSSGVLTYGTYVGGPNGQNFAYDVAVAATNQVVVVGATTGGANFPTTPGAFQPGFGGGSGDGDAFLLEIDTSVTGAGGLLYGTYYGGTNNEAFYGVAVDSSGKVYACGYTAVTRARDGHGRRWRDPVWHARRRADREVRRVPFRGIEQGVRHPRCGR